MSEKIYGFIPARDGSRRLSGKNIRLIGGKSLVEYSINASLSSRFIHETVVSTDDPVVKRIAERRNIRCIDRKKELCADYISMQEIINDFIKSLPSYNGSDCIVLLQPPSPLRTSEDIDNGIKIFKNSDFDSVVSVKEIAPFTYYPNGAVYVFKNKIYTDNMGMFLMPKNRSVDIDNLFDLKMCEYILGCKKR